MYIVRGFNVSPAEVEEVLLGFPGVTQVAVVGVPDQRMGEVGAAHVVLREGVQCGELDVIKFARDRMANYKVPRYVRFLERLPMNSTGKVQKVELKATFSPAGAA
jgi:HIP---CoA ligase